MRNRITQTHHVVPRAGDWIETDKSDNNSIGYVVPRAGDWIETEVKDVFREGFKLSPVRGAG